MPPNTEDKSSSDTYGFQKINEDIVNIDKHKKTYKIELVWRNIIWFIVLHCASLYGLYSVFTEAKWQSNLFLFLTYILSAIGITVGVHRLWAHRTYTAKWPLRLLLIILNTLVFQGSVINWSRDHRVHHKFSDTDADPHNSKRGLFYSHIGWLCVKKGKETIEKGKQIDLSDLYDDPIVAFQHKYYLYLMPVICFILPTLTQTYFWNETFSTALVMVLLRYTITLHCTWSINSFGHTHGSQPYDKSLLPRENKIISLVAFGEGFHNYHHAFPWDYKTSELPFYSIPNPSTAVIDFMAWVGLATNMKYASEDIIKKRSLRTGDGSHNTWGWNDPDLNEEEKSMVKVINKN